MPTIIILILLLPCYPHSNHIKPIFTEATARDPHTCFQLEPPWELCQVQLGCTLPRLSMVSLRPAQEAPAPRRVLTMGEEAASTQGCWEKE